MSINNYKVRPNVLLIEDDEHYGKALSRLLSDECNKVEHVVSCEEALTSIAGRESYFDVIILDHELAHGKSGLECLRALKAMNVPAEVIVLTGNGSRDLGVEMMREGAFRYFTKQSENDLELIYAIEVASDLSRMKKGNKDMANAGQKMNSMMMLSLLVCFIAIIAVVILNVVAPNNFLLSLIALCSLILVLFFSISGVRSFKITWKEGGKAGDFSAESTANTDHRVSR